MGSVSPEMAGAGKRGLRRRLWRAWLTVALLCVGVAAGSGCMEPSATADDGDEAFPADAGARDAATDCRGAQTSETCRERTGCMWLTLTCDVGGVVGGCFGGSAASEVELECPSAPARDTGRGGGGDTCGTVGAGSCGPSSDTAVRDAGTSDGGTESEDVSSDVGGSGDASSDVGGPDTSAICESYSAPKRCERDKRCKWWKGTCDGQVVREKCVARGRSDPPVDCSSVAPAECHQFDSEAGCPAASCDWVEEGCAGGTTNTLEVTDCLPSGGCRTDRDCPANHACSSLWIDPCATSSCTACGQSADRCVPDTYLSP